MVSGDETLAVIPSNARAASPSAAQIVQVLLGVEASEYFDARVLRTPGPSSRSRRSPQRMAAPRSAGAISGAKPPQAGGLDDARPPRSWLYRVPRLRRRCRRDLLTARSAAPATTSTARAPLRVQFTLPQIPSAKEARIFEALLEQGSREDVSYPWPLDMRSLAAGVPLINGSTPPGASVPLKGLVPGFVMRVGQPFAVVLADGSGSIHKARSEVIADNAGHATVPIFPWTRTTFADALVVEIEHPRIRGILSWDGSTQPAYGRRGFSFTITERK
jgi:hypothetical protein